MFDHINQHRQSVRNNILETYGIQKAWGGDNDHPGTEVLEKGEGEGSKGGVVIGHTTSGKPIYRNANHPSHAKFSMKDHSEAVDLHATKRFAASKDGHEDAKKFHHQQMNEHHSISKVMGGNVAIGKTKSGKPIRHASKHADHKDFTPQDHRDAAELHRKLAKEAHEDTSKHSYRSNNSPKGLSHEKKAKHHEEEADWKEHQAKNPPATHKKHSVTITKENSAGGEAPGEYHYHARSQYEAEGMHISKYGRGDIKHKNADEHNAAYEKKQSKLKKGEDELLQFSTPLEYQQLQKSRIANIYGGEQLGEIDEERIEKGQKATIGEKRNYGGKDYIKTANGWRPVGKTGGKVKEAHDTIHGKKEHPLHAKLDKFLSTFPDDAKSWKDATDEVRDLARSAREHYNELDLDVYHDDPKAVQAMNWKEFKTPGEWNSKGKAFIKDVVGKMSDKTKDAYLKRHEHWLNKDEES